MQIKLRLYLETHLPESSTTVVVTISIDDPKAELSVEEEISAAESGYVEFQVVDILRPLVGNGEVTQYHIIDVYLV